MNEELLQIVSKLSSPRILVVGDYMLDVYIYGDALRISPEAPVPVLKVRKLRHFRGIGCYMGKERKCGKGIAPSLRLSTRIDEVTPVADHDLYIIGVACQHGVRDIVGDHALS